MTVVRDLPREYARALRQCTPTQRKWLRELLRNGFRDYRAAKTLGMSSGNVSKWKRNPAVMAVLQLMDDMATTEHLVTQSFVIGQYKAIAAANLKDLVDESGQPIPLHQLPDQVASALSERTVEANGTVKVKFHPKSPALDALANLKSLTKTRLEVTGKDGAPLNPENTTSDREIARRLLFVLERGAQAQPEG